MNPNPATHDGATHLTLNLSHLALAVSPSSCRELLLAVSSLDCKRRKHSTPNSTQTNPLSGVNLVWEYNGIAHGILEHHQGFLYLFTDAAKADHSREEKSRTMTSLRHRVLPPQLLLKWLKVASFCLCLLHPEPNSRLKMG
ncbi:hypothetical protein C1H46_029399 [Malus baccata]|uniref:Uncharacterized protein n=1 Tax=Malus baccata TaxID=106549 RepID=A0A540LF64_MALBA|nr:hypothetical protein C1H46_029399 [Malus baccata]